MSRPQRDDPPALADGWLEGWLEGCELGWLELGCVVAANAAVVLGTKLDAMPMTPPALTVSIAASASLEMFNISVPFSAPLKVWG